MTDVRRQLEAYVKANAVQCGSCDYGMPMGCRCVDARPAVCTLGGALEKVLQECDLIETAADVLEWNTNAGGAYMIAAKKIRKAISSALPDVPGEER